MKEAWKPVYPLTLSLSLSLSLSCSFSVIHSHSKFTAQQSQYSKVTRGTFSVYSLFLFLFSQRLSYRWNQELLFFLSFCLPVCEAVKRNRVWLRSRERLFEESHLLSSFLSVYSSRLVPHVLLCFNTLLWGRMSRTHYGTCVVLWIFSLVACKVPGKMNFYCYCWYFF